MPDLVFVIGAGGFGRETLDVVEASSADGAITLGGVIDANPSRDDLERLSARGIAYIGDEATWMAMAPEGAKYIVAIGAPQVRERVVARMSRAGFQAATVVHPRAVVGTQAQIGEGVVIAAGVQISTNVAIGSHSHLNPGCIIGHDAVLEDFVSVNPGAIVSGNVRIGRGSLVGAGSVILQELQIGASTTVGAAACVTRSTGDGVTVAGVPARVMGSEPNK